jgi:hypothetical protein
VGAPTGCSRIGVAHRHETRPVAAYRTLGAICSSRSAECGHEVNRDNMSEHSRVIEVRSPTLVFWIACALAVLFGLFTVGCAVVRGIPLIGVIGLPASLAVAGVPLYFATHPWVVLRVANDGFYTGQHKVLVPWHLVARVDLIDGTERLSQFQQAALAVAKNNQSRVVIGVEFTPHGKAKLGRDFGQNKEQFPDEDMVLSTMFLELDGTGLADHAALVQEMQQRISLASQ